MRHAAAGQRTSSSRRVPIECRSSAGPIFRFTPSHLPPVVLVGPKCQVFLLSYWIVIRPSSVIRPKAAQRPLKCLAWPPSQAM
eukprot:COSAG01_NODE_21582_length_895_cov_0.957286_2_plen_82_part_01